MVVLVNVIVTIQRMLQNYLANGVEEYGIKINQGKKEVMIVDKQRIMRVEEIKRRIEDTHTKHN